jgi:hypothetical protein
MTDPADALLASDADRDAAANVLAEAVATGRITLADQEARLNALFAAKTRDEVAAATAGLPAVPVSRSGLYTTADAHRCVAVGGNVSRSGRLPVGRFCSVTAVFGQVDLDLRAAEPAQREISLTIFAFAGRVAVTVPPHWGLNTKVFVLGNSAAVPDRADDGRSPYLRISGTAIASTFQVIQA